MKHASGRIIASVLPFAYYNNSARLSIMLIGIRQTRAVLWTFAPFPCRSFRENKTVFSKGDQPFTFVILLGAFVASSVYHFRVDNIFACPASGYTSDRYLAHCDAANYGDYEHGAYWFDLEPAAEKSAASADVLFLGDSRVQFAFSTPATAQWFSSASIRYHLLGFVAFENSIFARALLHRLKPRAKVYVIPVADFFQQSAAPEAKVIMQDDAARSRYAVKRRWQFVHEAFCMKLATICGHAFAVFRSRQTGMWYTSALSMSRAMGVRSPMTNKSMNAKLMKP